MHAGPQYPLAVFHGHLASQEAGWQLARNQKVVALFAPRGKQALKDVNQCLAQLAGERKN